jgi:glycosyltransferase involved in cell wall biosynthesis
MKVGIDIRAAKWYRGTGIGNYTYSLIHSLNDVDKLNNYILFAPEEQSLNNGIHFNNNFTVKNITENKESNFWDEVNLPNILKDKEVEIYHVPQNGVGLPLDKKCPFIITLHDVIPYRMPETVGEKYLKIFFENMHNIISLCDGIITVSNFSKQDIIKTFNYPPDKIFVTHLASEEIYRVIDKNESDNFMKANYKFDNEYILYVGGFSPRKNIVGLIEAFSKLTSIYSKDLNLIITGKQGKSYDLYKKKAEELHVENKVIFPGFIPCSHLPYFYNSASLFVYPSFYEGFGLPPLEAMSCGVPVITSNLTSIPEIVGDAAILINPYDTDELYTSMYKCLSDSNLRYELKTRGLKKASEFSWNKTALKTIEAYETVLSKT